VDLLLPGIGFDTSNPSEDVGCLLLTVVPEPRHHIDRQPSFIQFISSMINPEQPTTDIHPSASHPPLNQPKDEIPAILKTRLTRRRLRPSLQIRVRVANRPGNSIKSEPRRLCRELHFGADVEKSEIPVDEVVGDAGRFVVDVDLAGEDVLCLRKKT